MKKPYNTRMKRKTPSAPAKYLFDNNLLKGDVLDYGCGFGKDVEVFGCDGYDPNVKHFSNIPDKQYDTIMCNYVLCVVPTRVACDVIRDVFWRSLKEGGRAYFSVRRDIKKRTKNTRVFKNDYMRVLVENSKFCIYYVEK